MSSPGHIITFDTRTARSPGRRSRLNPTALPKALFGYGFDSRQVMAGRVLAAATGLDELSRFLAILAAILLTFGDLTLTVDMRTFVTFLCHNPSPATIKPLFPSSISDVNAYELHFHRS